MNDRILCTDSPIFYVRPARCCGKSLVNLDEPIKFNGLNFNPDAKYEPPNFSKYILHPMKLLTIIKVLEKEMCGDTASSKINFRRVSHIELYERWLWEEKL
mgnify:CR=1 FL=1